jgi:hypothetical protein
MTAAPAPVDVHIDLLGGPLTEVISFRCNKAMSQALRKRALAERREIGFIVRDVLRVGAQHLDRPIDFSATNL